jgi:hypothetical protein
MNRKERRAAGVKVARPALRDLVTALCLAAPWIIRTRWPPRFAHSVEMSFAGKEVLRRFQYGGDMASCVLLIRNAGTKVCVGDSRAAYDLLSRRGDFGKAPPSYEEWRSQMLFSGDPKGEHTVLKAHAEGTRAFADLTFGQVAVASKGAIQVPPAFAGFGEVEWPSVQMGEVSFQYAPTPEPPEMRSISADDWSGLIDDFETLAGIALGCRNDEQAFVAVMQRQMQDIGR